MAKLAVRVQPRAKRNQVTTAGDALVVKVTAPPVEGAANRAVVELLARELKVPRSAVSIISGERARQKVIRVEGLSDAEAKQRLGVLPM